MELGNLEKDGSRANDLKTQPTEKIAFDPPNRLAKLSLKSLSKSVGKRHHIPKEYNGTSKSARPKTVIKIWRKEYI